MPDRQDLLALAHIFAHLDDVLAHGGGAEHLDAVLVRALGVFEHDCGIGPGRDHAAGVDDGGLPRPDRFLCVPPHDDLADHVKEGGQAARCAKGIGGAHGVAIDGRAGEFGQVVRGAVRAGQKAVNRLRGGDGLGQGRRRGSGR